MWKSIGSIHSNDDKSIRSNRSREETRFEPFHQNIKRRSNLSPDIDRTFCHQYMEKKREDKRNMTYNSRAKSQKSLRLDDGAPNDMFTSMRNILSKEEQIESKIESKNFDEGRNCKNPEGDDHKNQRVFKTAMSRMKNLKREQTKLKSSLQNQFTTFKNMFYQMEDMIHTQQEGYDKMIEDRKAVGPATQSDPELLRQILEEAVGIQKYFAEMDRKKATIMNRLSNE